MPGRGALMIELGRPLLGICYADWAPTSGAPHPPDGTGRMVVRHLRPTVSGAENRERATSRRRSSLVSPTSPNSDEPPKTSITHPLGSGQPENPIKRAGTTCQGGAGTGCRRQEQQGSSRNAHTGRLVAHHYDLCPPHHAGGHASEGSIRRQSRPGLLVVMPSTPSALRRRAWTGSSTVQT